MRLEVRSTRPCWVSLTVDGRRVFSRTMQPGDKEAVDVRELAVVVVGDAGAFEFTVNGRPGRSLGASGEVATARISHDTLSGYLR